MRTIFATLATTLFVFGLSALLPAQQEITLTGEVVDVTCYKKFGFEKGTGTGHLSCATDCAKKGQVLGILTDGDGLLKITGAYAANNNAKLMDYIGKYVEARGTRDRYTDYSSAINVAAIAVVKKTN